jgi:RNA polymerase sigma-70 factor (ECF subfamily)
VGSSSQGRTLSFPISWESSESTAIKDACALEVNDEDSVARLQRGDSSALHILFERYSRLVFDIGWHILRDRGEAEEIVQDVFFYVYRKAKLFDCAKGLVKTWILQIAYYRSLDRRSYLARRSFYFGTEIDSLEDTLVGATNLEREVGAKLSREQLQKAFKRLPEKQRQTLELYYFEGLELREISDRLNEPLGNVRHNFYRGLERLRRSAIVRKLREK